MSTTTIETRQQKILSEIDKDLEELRPKHEEYLALQDFRQRVAGTNGSATPARPSATTPRRGRTAGRPSRTDEFLRLVGEQPGVTIPELAKAMSIDGNYLYRIRAKLEESGKVRKDGGKHYLVEAAA